MKALLTSGNLRDAVRKPSARRVKFRLCKDILSAILIICSCYTHKKMTCQIILGIFCVFLLQVAQK